MPWKDKPVIPEYLKEYERQKALIKKFPKYQGVYDGLGISHLTREMKGNNGKFSIKKNRK